MPVQYKKISQDESQPNELEETFNLSSTPPPLRFLPPPRRVRPTDGVFSNMSAKPETNMKSKDMLPSYEEASADTAPSYWETTVITPGTEDTILVEGLPVGNILSFLWNLMVAATFHLVGFLITYMLHTSHAAKNGGLAGLGITFVQYGFYIRSRGTLDEDFDYDGEGHDTIGQDATQANTIAYIVMFIGWFMVLFSVSNYIKVRKVEKIITVDAIV